MAWSDIRDYCYSTIAPFYHIRAKERAKYATLLHCRTGQKYGLNRSEMAAQSPQNEPNFALFDLDFQTDELFTEMDFITEQTETSETVNVAVLTEEREQTEINGQKLDDQDVDNFIVENRNKNTTKKTQSDLNVFYKWAKSVKHTRTGI